MSSLLIIVLAFLLGSIHSSARHVININSSILVEFSSLAWDPIARHFVAGSSLSPAVYAIPDEGTVKCLLLEPSFNSSGISATAVAVDYIRQTLIVALSNHSSVVAYDLKSYKRIFTVPLLELDGDPGGVAVDLESGDVFVSSASRGVVLKVGLEGTPKKVTSEFQVPINLGLGGLVHTSHGHIITVQPTTQKLFNVDSKNGTVKEILSRDNTKMLIPAGNIIALRTNVSLMVTNNETLRSVESDATWERAALTDKVIKLGDGNTTVVAVTMRDGTTYALLKSQYQGYRIEEVSWREPPDVFLWVIVSVWGLFYSGVFLSMFMRQSEDCEYVMCYLFRRKSNLNYHSNV